MYPGRYKVKVVGEMTGRLGSLVVVFHGKRKALVQATMFSPVTVIRRHSPSFKK